MTTMRRHQAVAEVDGRAALAPEPQPDKAID
jgi:hypothetical protein